LLQDLRTHIPSTNHGISNQYDKSRHVAPTSSSIASSPSQTLPPEPTGSAAVEGESSLSAHSIFVSDFLQSFVQKDSGQHSDPEIQRTLDVLSDIVSASRQQPRTRELALPNARSQRAWHRNKYELPPIQKAVALIHAAKGEQALISRAWLSGGHSTHTTHHQRSNSPAPDGFTSTSWYSLSVIYASRSISRKTLRHLTLSASTLVFTLYCQTTPSLITSRKMRKTPVWHMLGFAVTI
jgi:hypothetical protein